MKHLVYFDANEYKFLLTGIDTRSEACQRFFREGLTISFTKILTDEAVNSWKFEIHVSTVRKKQRASFHTSHYCTSFQTDIWWW